MNDLMTKAHAMVDALNRKSGASVTVTPNGEARHTALAYVSENDLRRLCVACRIDVASVLGEG